MRKELTKNIDFVSRAQLSLFINKKINILNNLSKLIINNDRIYNYYCFSVENEFIEEINNAIEVHTTSINNNFDDIIIILKDTDYHLSYGTILYIKKNFKEFYYNTFLKTNQKINNFLDRKIFTQINNLDINQENIIYDQQILKESINQISGNNYDIMMNKYLINTFDNDKIRKKIYNFYNDIFKKLSSYYLAANVLSSGEISVNDSMIHTSTLATKASLDLISNLGASVPLGTAVTNLAAAGGIHYLNKEQMNDNINYNNLITSVVHTDSISKLSAYYIVKNIDFSIFDESKLNNNYINYFCKTWKKSQLKLIENGSFANYNLQSDNIKELTLNISNYHNELCKVTFDKFYQLINKNKNNFFNNLFNLCCCIDTSTNMFFNQNKNINSIDSIVDMYKLKSSFSLWKNLK